jgi:hypothetical protein
MRHRKGIALADAAPSAIAIMALILVVSIGSTVLQETRDTQYDLTTYVDARQNITVDTSAGEQAWTFVSGSDTDAAAQTTGVYAVNATNVSQAYDSSNFTATSTGVTWLDAIANETSVEFRFNYTYNDDTYASNISDTGMGPLGTYSDFFPVIVVVIVFAIIIGMFFLMFGGSRLTSGRV